MNDDDDLPAGQAAEPAQQKPDADDRAYEGRADADKINKLVRQRREAERQAQLHERRAADAETRARQAEERLAARELEDAKAASRQAVENGDAKAQVDANEALYRATHRVEQVKNQPAPQVSNAPVYSDRARQWIDERPWFETDNAAKQVALTAHGEALARGFVGDSDEYWGFIDGKVASRFPKLYGESDEDEGEPEAQPVRRVAVPPVAPARRAAIAPNGQRASRLPSLTAEEVAMAKTLGMTAQEYAAGKAAVKDMP